MLLNAWSWHQLRMCSIRASGLVHQHPRISLSASTSVHQPHDLILPELWTAETCSLRLGGARSVSNVLFCHFKSAAVKAEVFPEVKTRLVVPPSQGQLDSGRKSSEWRGMFLWISKRKITDVYILTFWLFQQMTDVYLQVWERLD